MLPAATTITLSLVILTSASQLYYMDTINRQSYPITEDETDQSEDVEDRILKLLGLPDSPRPAYNHLRENAAPQFMLHLYKEIQKSEGLDEIVPTQEPLMENIGPEFRNMSFDMKESDKINEVDIVISFVNHVGSNKLGLAHEEDKRFYFELDDVPSASEMTSTELRIFKRPSEHDYQNYFITVFRIDEDRMGEDKYGLTMLDNLIVNSTYSGWLVFNVSSAMESWMADPSTNFGLYLQVLTTSGEDWLPHRIGIVNRHGEEVKQGFMVGFFKSLEPLSRKLPTIDRPKRIKRSTPNQQADYWESPDSKRLSRKMCQRRQLYVKFKRLGFDSWIIAPDGYPAFYCEGECSFPLNAHMNATNHAIIQTLVSLIQPRKFPKACCAPKTLDPITVLYFDETQNVVMKRYRNMVVKSCGCR